MARMRSELQRLLPGIAVSAFVMITVSVLLLVSLDPDRPPRAVMVISKDRAYVGEGIVLDAENSSDPDGGRISYRWSIEGEVFSSSGRWVYVFPYPGQYSIVLEVTDDEGGSDTREALIEVLPRPSGA